MVLKKRQNKFKFKYLFFIFIVLSLFLLLFFIPSSPLRFKDLGKDLKYDLTKLTLPDIIDRLGNLKPDLVENDLGGGTIGNPDGSNTIQLKTEVNGIKIINLDKDALCEITGKFEATCYIQKGKLAIEDSNAKIVSYNYTEKIDSKTNLTTISKEEIITKIYDFKSVDNSVIVDKANNKIVFDLSNLKGNEEFHYGENSTIIQLDYTHDLADINYIGGTSYGSQIKWNITAIPVDQTISDGTLCLYIINVLNDPTDAQFSVWYINDLSWDESSNNDTINEQPVLNGTNVTFSSVEVDTWTCFNVTTQLQQSYANGDFNFTVRFEDNTLFPAIQDVYDGETIIISLDPTFLQFTDRENTGGSGNLPYLNITYTEGGDTTNYIDTCQDLSTENTTYTLNQSVNSTGTCFNIMANNITLDCVGYTINYSQSSGGYGVNSTGYNFTIVKNCIIIPGNITQTNSYTSPIYFYKANNGTIDNNTIRSYGNYAYGIYLFNGSYNNIVSNNDILTSGTYAYGVYLFTNSGYNNLSNNNIRIINVQTPTIYLLTSSNNNIISNNNLTTIGNSDPGVRITTSLNNTISGNNITTIGSTSYGVHLTGGSHYNNITNNIIDGRSANAGNGIYIDTSSNNTISSNNIKTLDWGILMLSSVNNLFLNNQVNSSQKNSYSIYGTELSHYNHTIGEDNLAEGKPVNYTFNADNLVFDGVDFTVYGEVIFACSRNITIKNSNFSDDGLNLFYTNTSTISNNIVNETKGVGIYLYSQSKDNYFINNTAIGNQYGLYASYNSNSNSFLNNYFRGGNNGVFLQSNANYNLFDNNTIISTGNAGFYPQSSQYTYANNNIIRGVSNGALFLYANHNSIYINNTIIGTTINGNGISFYSTSSDNVTLIGNKVYTNTTGTYPLYIVGGFNNFSMIDNMLNSSTSTPELGIASVVIGGTWNFTNVTKEDGTPIRINWTASANGTLNMKWYLDVNVTNSTGALGGANVTGWNNVPNEFFSELTDVTGFIPKQTLLEYTNVNNTLITYYSNYTINTTLFGYNNDSQSVNMSQNRQLNIILFSDIISPYFIIIPTNITINYLQGFGVGFSADDEYGFDNYAINYTSLFQINKTGWLENNTQVGVGVYLINVTINDTNNNINWTIFKVTVNQITPMLNLTSSAGWIFNAANYSTITGSGCPAELTCNLYLQTIDVGNPYTALFPVGAYPFNYSTPGNNNYTGTSNFTILYSINVGIPTSPTWTILTNKTLQVNTSLSHQLNATDDDGIDCYTVNDTTNFAITCLGLLSNATAMDIINIYYLNITINDTIGNLNSGVIWVNFTESVSPLLAIITPINGNLYTGTSVLLNISPSQTIDTYWYSLDSGNTNTTSSNPYNVSITTGGTYTIEVWGNNSVNMIGTNSSTFDFVYDETIDNKYFYLYFFLFIVTIILMIIGAMNNDYIINIFAGMLIISMGLALNSIGYPGFDDGLLKTSVFYVLIMIGGYIMVYNSYKFMQEGL